MELVYLWVEKYKNIENQGFNFSPRFTCKYDEITKKLTIEEKKDYVSIFPDNINVTAIVGENGSGKSSIIQQLLTEDNFRCSSAEESQYLDKKLWVYDNDTKEIEHLNCDDISFYNNILLHNEEVDSDLYTNKYNINQYLEKKLDIIDKYKAHNISISFFVHANNLDYLSNFYFLPTHIELTLIEQIVKDDLKDLTSASFLQQENNFNEMDKFLKFINQQLKIAINIFNTKSNIKDYLCIREFIYKLNKKEKNSLVLFEYIISNNYQIKKFNNCLDKYIFNIDPVFKEIVKSVNHLMHDVSFNRIIIDLKKDDVQKLLSNIHRGFLKVDFFRYAKGHNKIYFSDLSTGEQKFIVIFAKIFYVIRKLFIDIPKDFILFLDEPEAYLHPNWQKQFLDYLIKFVKNTEILKDRNFSIFITSHSPFILSDLPKENVIFLEKGKQVYPNIETFGANIHTLLSHGFFMKEGLMGEFAKEKINKAIEYLNKKELTMEEIDYCENIISIIGEPILKRQLQKMLDSKRLSEIENIKKQIAELQQKLDEHQHAQN